MPDVPIIGYRNRCWRCDKSHEEALLICYGRSPVELCIDCEKILHPERYEEEEPPMPDVPALGKDCGEKE